MLSDGERGYTVAIMPWSDPDNQLGMAAVDRIFQAPQIEDLTHAF
jgi:hypothetical protein